MSSSTTNLGLVKPAYSEDADVAVINSNMDTLDTKMGAVGSVAVQTQINNLQDGLAIIANGDTHPAITSGQFVYVKNNTHSLSEGLYVATSNIAQNASISSSNVTADTSGGLNGMKSITDTLNSKLLKPITVSLDSISNNNGSYNHTTSGLTLVTENMKAIDIEVGTPESFRAPVTVTTGNGTVNVTCPSVVGSSTISVSLVNMQPVDGGQNVPTVITSSEFDILAGRIGTLSNLNTSTKTSTVGAINELNTAITIDQYTNTDANTLTATGTYYMYTGCTNVPENYVHISVFHAQGLTGFVQMAYAATSGKIYKREYTSGSFTDWKELALNSQLTKVSHIENLGDYKFYTGAITATYNADFETLIKNFVAAMPSTGSYSFHLIASQGSMYLYEGYNYNGIFVGTWTDLYGSAIKRFVYNTSTEAFSSFTISQS